MRTILSALLLVSCGPVAVDTPEPVDPPVQPPPLNMQQKADSGTQMQPTPDAGVVMQDAGMAPVDAGMRPDSGIEDPVDAGSPPPGLDLSGVWAARVITSQFATAPIIGEVQSTVTSFAKLDVTQSGGQVSVTTRLCAIEIPPVAGLQTVYPQSAIDAVPDGQGTATIDVIEVGATYETPPTTEYVGWTPDGVDDAIPLDPADPRVDDPDADGNPGVTVQTTGFINADVYIVNRATVSFSGTIITEDRIEGLNDTESEQVILDATNGLIAAGPVDSRPDPDPNNSTFVMVRMPAGSVCTDVLAGRDTLF